MWLECRQDWSDVGSESTRTQSGRVLWFTLTIVNFIPRAMASHWSQLKSWLWGPVTIASRAELKCVKHAYVWLILTILWISLLFVGIFLQGNHKNAMCYFCLSSIHLESLLLTALRGRMEMTVVLFGLRSPLIHCGSALLCFLQKSTTL